MMLLLRALRAIVILTLGIPAFVAGFLIEALIITPFGAGREAFESMATSIHRRQRGLR